MKTRDQATWPEYRRRLFLIRDLVLLGGATVALFSVTVLRTRHSGTWEWVQRSGAPLVVIGTILLSRPSYRTSYRRHELSSDPNIELDEAGTRELLQRRLDQKASTAGLVLTSCGSLLWAYGDLLPRSWLGHIHL